jgi:hypothetical protein
MFFILCGEIIATFEYDTNEDYFNAKNKRHTHSVIYERRDESQNV